MQIPKGGIAFFDSGIGGLTVMSECQNYLHNQILYYYGDNAHAPYGNLPSNLIRQYVTEAFEQFNNLKVQAAVIACNTATALCIDELRQKYSFPIIGSEPAVMLAAKQGGEVFVLTTRATYESERFHCLCKLASERYPSAKILPFPCDTLAGEIERNLYSPLYDFTQSLPRGQPSAVVLGCTHYIYIKEIIAGFYACPVYDGNVGIAKRLCATLESLQNREKRPLQNTFEEKMGMATTADPQKGDFDLIDSIGNVKKEKISQNSAKKSGNVGSIFFLGSGKNYCKWTNEQMFAMKNGKKMVKVDENPKKN